MSEGNFECKISGKRESSNGIFITLQIQPDDYDSSLATLRVGSSLVIGWSEIIDSSVQKIYPIGSPEQVAAQNTLNTAFRNTLGPANSKRKFEELSLSQQAALRCQDTDFQFYLSDTAHHPPRTDWTAADEVRERCRVESRAEFDKNSRAGGAWLILEDQYQAWLTEKRYGDQVR